jgi:polyisoprenoid-binding protein YceI
MALRHVARTALGCAFATGFFITAAAIATGQEAAPTPLALNTFRISIDGTSNVHEYTASTTSVRLTHVTLANGVAGPDVWDAIVKPGALDAVEFAIPAATLSSPRSGLDKNMHKALKVQEFPDITFRLLRLAPRAGGPGALRATGILRIAGVEREIAFDITTARKDATLSVKGEVPLLMTDFGIVPPKAMLGMLKTDPKVTIRFETVLAISLT